MMADVWLVGSKGTLAMKEHSRSCGGSVCLLVSLNPGFSKVFLLEELEQMGAL